MIASEKRRSAFFVQRSVIFALFLREIKTRFDSPSEYIWAILNPLTQVTLFALIFWILGRSSRYADIPFALVLVTGIVPFQFFRSVVNRGMNAFQANKGLFFYRQVKPIDTIISATLVELCVYTVVYWVFLLGCGFLGFEISPPEPGILLLVYLVFVVLSFSITLCISIGNFHYPIIGSIFRFLMRILYFVSGVMFPISAIPPKYREYLMYNPILHVLELSRDAFFKNYPLVVGNWNYLLGMTLVLFVTGMALYRTNRFVLLNPGND